MFDRFWCHELFDMSQWKLIAAVTRSESHAGWTATKQFPGVDKIEIAATSVHNVPKITILTVVRPQLGNYRWHQPKGPEPIAVVIKHFVHHTVNTGRGILSHQVVQVLHGNMVLQGLHLMYFAVKESETDTVLSRTDNHHRNLFSRRHFLLG